MSEITISTKVATIGGETVNAVNARELWKFLESKQEFSNWIQSRIKKFGFSEGIDFAVDKIINGKNAGQFTPTEYIVSLDMAKELAMVENNAKGRQARLYFIEVEKRARAAAMDPMALADAVVERAVARVAKFAADNARLEAENRIMRNFMPTSKAGEIADNGQPKTQFRRGYYTSGKGRPVSMLIEHQELPGLFEEFELVRVNQSFRG
ncbi:MAG: antA/AntB antirepressor family protein [Victivallaceae bacterium]